MRAVWAGDPEQSTFNIVTMEERIADTVWQRRLSGALFVVFAALASVGILREPDHERSPVHPG